MNTRDRGFRQKIKEHEVDAEFNDVELAIQNVVKDTQLFGLISGGGITPSVSLPQCDVAVFRAHDKNGKRLALESPLVALDFTNDTAGSPTIPGAGEFRWITLVARHGYLPSDARTDGNGDPFNYVRTEVLSATGDDNPVSANLLQIVSGATAGSAGAAVKPSVGSDDIVIADLLLNDTGLVDGGAAGVSYSRMTRVQKIAVQPYSSLNSYGPADVVLYQGEAYLAITTVPPGIAPSNQSYWIVWHRSPTPGSYTSEVTSWMNARRQRVSGIDHFGFPSGHVRAIDESWDDINATTKTATGTGGWFGKWAYRVNNGGGFAGTGIQALGPSTDATSFPWGPNLLMNVFGQSVDAAAVVELARPMIYMQQSSLVFEGSWSLDPGGGSGVPLPNTSWAFGLSNGGIIASNAVAKIDTGDAVFNGAFFYSDGAASNWYTKTSNGIDPGETAASVVAVAINAPHFFKIVIQGSAAGDFGTAKVLYFVDGALVHESAISFNNFMLAPFFRVSGSQGEQVIARFGSCRLRTRLALNDEF